MDEQRIHHQRNVKIAYEADLCVVGGSCTGLFAAVRAARLGLRVCLIERSNCLGGTATNGLVNIWHSFYDTEQNRQIISGLTEEVQKRLTLEGNGVVYKDMPDGFFRFNSEELKIELDALVKESDIKLYLHTVYCDILTDGEKLTHVIIQNKDGCAAIKARFVIDATGDGDIARDLGVESYRYESLQPPTACFLLHGNFDGLDIKKLLKDHSEEFALERDWGWGIQSIYSKNISMRADFHTSNVGCDNAEALTSCEMEGRLKMRKFIRLLRKYGASDGGYALASACSQLGIRDTRHYKTNYTACETDLLYGKKFSNAIMQGSYRIDVHCDDGIVFKYLNGEYIHVAAGSYQRTKGNWMQEEGYTGAAATFYQLPADVLINQKYHNFISVGRMLNADANAFGALRVMVNLNQLGEAAGVMAAISIDGNAPLQDIDGIKVREVLKKGGSAL